MKLASFRLGGRSSYGLVLENGLVDLGGRLGEDYGDLRSLLAKGGLGDRRLHGFLERAAADAGLGDAEFLPVIPNPSKIICVGLNYRDHVEETGRSESAHPAVFFRLAASQVGHRGAILLPPESDKLDYEGELAVIIGKAGRNRWRGIRPTVRSIAMNPVDHPNGGRTNGGKHWATPWGKPAKGARTRKNKATQKYIIRSRHDAN